MYFDALTIEHVLMRRVNVPFSIAPQTPALTRRGFADLQTIDILIDPDLAADKINRVLTQYAIWKEWGPLPRSALPSYPAQSAVEKFGRARNYMATGEQPTRQQIGSCQAQTENQTLQLQLQQQQLAQHNQFLRVQQELNTAMFNSRVRAARQQADARMAMNCLDAVVIPGSSFYREETWW
jgi:hypothetical protein